MSRANALAIAELMGGTVADDTQLQKFYADLMWDYANREIIGVASLIQVVNDTATYDYPTDCGNVYGIFFDDIFVPELRLRELEMQSPGWRDWKGRPFGFVKEQVNTRQFTLVPTPHNTAPGDPNYPHGAPFGVDFPGDYAMLLHSERRDDLPDWLDLPLAFTVLAREFGRESNHRDAVFAEACLQLSNLLTSFIFTMPTAPA